MRRTTLGVLGATFMLGGTLFATPAQAQALDDNFYLQVSGFWAASVDSRVMISPVSNPSVGSGIDLEEDLNLDNDEILPAIFANARVGSGFSLGLEYYSVGRSTSTTLARTIIVNDVMYPVGGTVDSGFNSDVYRLTVGWAFVRNENFEFGAAIGLHATDVEFFLTGQGKVGPAPVSTQTRRTEYLAPVPTVGLFATAEAAPGLTFNARADYLSLNVGEYDGSLLNFQASMAWRFARSFGAGIAYRYVDYSVDVTRTNYIGRFDYQFSGPSIFLEVGL